LKTRKTIAFNQRLREGEQRAMVFIANTGIIGRFIVVSYRSQRAAFYYSSRSIASCERPDRQATK